MSDEARILQKVRAAAAKRILFLPHAVRQMSRPERMISPDEVRQAVMTDELAEDYPEDARGHSCLILGGADRKIHAVCSPKEDYLATITAYVPNQEEWADDLRTRRRT